MAEQLQQLEALARPILEGLGFSLYDLELHGASLVVAIDRSGGVDLDALAEATQALSKALDEADPIAGRYTLEVTSPGLERRLRTPEHFSAAVGETVSVRTMPDTDGPRRVSGRLTAAGAEGIELADVEGFDGPVHVSYADIERARTVFAWGAAPAPSPSRGKAGGRAHAKTGRVSTR